MDQLYVKGEHDGVIDIEDKLRMKRFFFSSEDIQAE